MTFQRPSLAFIWAFTATLTGALATLTYLLSAHGQPWAAEFIQLYSSLGIVSGWMNALLYFIVPRSLFFQTRKASLLFWGIAYISAASTFRQLFHHDIDFLRGSFLAVNLLPVLYANAFGLEFYEGNYPWPYKRVVTFNSLLLLAGIAAYMLHRSESGLYGWTLAVGVPMALIWTIDRWNRIDVPAQRSGLLHPLLNPSLPVLERTLWDQFVLARLDIAKWSLPIYLLGRVVTFTGNVIYSYFISTNSRVHRSARRGPGRWVWLVMFIAAAAAAGAVRFAWSAFLLGQIFSWLITTILSSEYDSESKIYPRLVGVWLLDLAIRSIGILVAQDVKDYLPFLVFSSAANLILTLILRKKWRSSQPREKTNTKLPLVDSPGRR